MNKLSVVALLSASLLVNEGYAKSNTMPTEPNLIQYGYANLKPSACKDSMYMVTLKEMYLILFKSDYYDRSKVKSFHKCLRAFADKADKVVMSSNDRNHLVAGLKDINEKLLGEETKQDKVLMSGINRMFALIARYIADEMPSGHDQVKKYVVEITSNEGRLMRKVHVEEAIELFRTLFVIDDHNTVVLKDRHNLRQAYKAWSSAGQQVGRELGHAFHTGSSYETPSKKGAKQKN
jgi:hypothetical protein